MKLFSMIAVLACIALPLSASDVEESSPEVVGGWRLEFTTPEGEVRSPMVVVGRQYQEFVAWYVAGSEPEQFSEVELDGEELKLTIQPKEFFGDVKATLVARLTEAGACAGTIKYAEEYGEQGEFDFKGKRIDPSDLGEKQTWTIDFVDPDGTSRNAQVTVISISNSDKLYAWYSSADYELPAKEVSVDGDRIEMSISTKTADGEKVDVTFRGVVDDDRVTGDVDWSTANESGSVPFKGQRES